MTQPKGRIIFLHGFTQSSSIFYAKTSALRKKLLKLNYDIIYLNAPLKLTPADFPTTDSLSKFGTVIAEPDEETNYRAWWFKNTGKIDTAPAIATLEKFLETGQVHEDDDTKDKKYLASYKETDDVPIVGVIGFSQGAALAGALARNFDALFGAKASGKLDLRFVVLYSGFKVEFDEFKGFYEFDSSNVDKKDAFKMLHVIGELDSVVEEDRAQSLYKEFELISDILKHPGGHFVPNSKILIDQVVNWIENAMVEEKTETDKKEDDLDDLDALMDMMDNLGKA